MLTPDETKEMLLRRAADYRKSGLNDLAEMTESRVAEVDECVALGQRSFLGDPCPDAIRIARRRNKT